MIEPITNQNDIYLYFEAIRQLKAKNVLDIGMTLKRCGAICRQVADSFIEPTVHLCGVDTNPDIIVPIYRSIYQEILTAEEFLNNESEIKEYDLAVLLKLTNTFFLNTLFIDFLKQHAKRLLMDHETGKVFLHSILQKNVKTISLDRDFYYLVE